MGVEGYDQVGLQGPQGGEGDGVLSAHHHGNLPGAEKAEGFLDLVQVVHRLQAENVTDVSDGDVFCVEA